jgi:hydroxyacylglutathione hydrolase
MPEKLFLEKVHSEGLAHISYIIGHGGQAAVIDPRRDVDVYVEIARRQEVRITHIFETHKNEDYVIGSLDLQRRTGAAVYHGEGLEWGYGQTVSEGDQFELGDIRLRVLQTPGHTFDSISLVLYDTASGEEPVGVFTGDVLFVGDVGRTDFYPDRAEEVAGLLYDSIFEKLLPLGDHVLLYPAHGAGSVCGSSMAAREFSSLGCERRFNRALQVTGREEFIRMKTSEHHYIPPYFQLMEKYNQRGSMPPMAELPNPQPLSPAELEEATEGGAELLDVREPEAFAGAFVPGSINIPLDEVPAYAGYLISWDKPILLVADDPRNVDAAVRYLVRIGYDRVEGYLHGGLHEWETTGRDLGTLGVTTAAQLNQQIAEGQRPPTVLDVRKKEEFEAGHIEGATHIFLGHLPDHLDEVSRDGHVVTFCGSGRRASVAASLLHRHGLRAVANNLGSMAACREVGCKIVP